MAPIALAAYLALFATVGFLFVLASLLLGKLLRPHAPSASKLATYECGEPAVGPGRVQFDLRFYVVALLFLIFEVEVAMFFPPAVVFGWANQHRAVASMPLPLEGGREVIAKVVGDDAVPATEDALNVALTQREREPNAALSERARGGADTLALASMLDLGVFFGVLLVGFAFVWWRGDLNWIRATRHPSTPLETAAMMTRMRYDAY